MSSKRWLEDVVARLRSPRSFTAAFVLVGVIVIGIGVFIIRDLSAPNQQARQTYSLPKLILLLCVTHFLAAAAVQMLRKGKMLGSIRRSETRLRDAIQSINEGMFVVNAEGLIEVWNRAMEQSTGRYGWQTIGRPLLEALPALEGTPVLDAVVGPARAEQGIYEVRLAGYERERIFEARISPFDGGTAVFFNDVTERRQAEQAQRESEELYRSLFENAPVGMYRTTPEGRLLLANPVLLQMLGRSSLEEPVAGGKEGGEFEPGYNRAGLKEALESSGEVKGLESEWARSDGTRIFVRENARAVRDADGGLLYLEGTVEDVTERKRAEDALKESQALFDSLVNSLPQNIFCKDMDGRFTFVNKAFCSMVGKRLEEVAGKTSEDFFAPGLADKHRINAMKVLGTGEVLNDIEEVIKHDGQKAYMQVVTTPRYDLKGGIVGVQGIFWDVTEKVQAEEALARERDLLQALMDSSPDYIYFKDRDSRFLRINNALMNRFGLTSSSAAIGKSDADYFAGDHVHHALEDEQRIINTGQPMIGVEERETWQDREDTWVSTTKMPLIDKEGRIVGTFGITRDITARKQAEAAMERSLAELLAVVSMVSEGDLTKRGAEGEDTLGRIACSINKMLDEFSAMLAEVKNIALSVSSNATEILAASEQISMGTDRQTDEVTNTSSAVEEMAASMNQVSRNAEASNEAARRALATADQGDLSVINTSEAMMRISEAVHRTAEKMRSLAVRSSEISEIINLINDVASQTNLLALNAAIEAAHAGEAGLGFSVVAEEIRKLAERSARATKDIGKLIKSIQSETAEALAAMENGMREVEDGTALATEARQALQNISGVVKQSADLIEEISVASEEQAKTTGNVATAMQTILSIALESSAGAQETTRTIHGMVSLSERLNEAISRFKIKEMFGRGFTYDMSAPPAKNGDNGSVRA